VNYVSQYPDIPENSKSVLDERGDCGSRSTFRMTPMTPKPISRSAALAATALTVSLLTTAPRVAHAQTITIGEASGVGGQAVDVPVTLDAPVDCAGLLLRLEFDPQRLELVKGLPGDILAGAQTLDAFSPEAGRANLAVIGLSETATFTARSGVVARLRLRIRGNAPTGYAPIRLTAAGVPALPASGLVDALGHGLAHTVNPGRVLVGIGGAAVSPWKQY